jgi:hypothetical protein
VVPLSLQSADSDVGASREGVSFLAVRLIVLVAVPRFLVWSVRGA